MAKDSLARGARSATFSGGQAERNDPIEFHGTVAAEDPDCELVKVCDDPDCGDPELCENCAAIPCVHGTRADTFCRLCARPAVVIPAPPSLEELAAKYQPMNDRVLLRRIEEKNERLVNLPDAFVQDSDMGEVIAVGDGMLIGGELRPINLKSGDVVRFGHYNAEDIEVEGVKVTLVSAFDVRLKIKT